MGFILDGLETEAYDRSYRDRDLLARILGYFRPHAGRHGPGRRGDLAELAGWHRRTDPHRPRHRSSAGRGRRITGT